MAFRWLLRELGNSDRSKGYRKSGGGRQWLNGSSFSLFWGVVNRSMWLRMRVFPEDTRTAVGGIGCGGVCTWGPWETQT